MQFFSRFTAALADSVFVLAGVLGWYTRLHDRQPLLHSSEPIAIEQYYMPLHRPVTSCSDQGQRSL